MEILKGLILVYTGAGAIACLVHMWRNRKEKGVVKVYAWTLVLEVILFVGGLM